VVREEPPTCIKISCGKLSVKLSSQTECRTKLWQILGPLQVLICCHICHVLEAACPSVCIAMQHVAGEHVAGEHDTPTGIYRYTIYVS